MKAHLAMRRIAVLLGALCTALGVWYIAVRPTTLTVAVGPPGSTQVAYVKNLAKVLHDTRQPVRLKIVPAEGTVASSGLLDRGAVDLAVLRSDDLESKDARSIVILHKRAISFVTRKQSETKAGDKKPVETKSSEAGRDDEDQDDANLDGAKKAEVLPVEQKDGAKQDKPIDSLRDIAGRPIGIIEVDTDTYKPLVERIMSHFDVEEDDLKLIPMKREAIPAAMAEGRIEGFLVIGNPASKPFRDMMSELTGKRKVPVDVSGVPAHEALALRFRELHTSKIPEGVYGTEPEEEEETVGLTLELTASSRLSDQTATTLTKALMEVRTRLRSAQIITYNLETPPVDEERRFLPHAGTEAFVNSEAKTLFEQYSDHIWLGLFAVGLVGSGIAGVMSWAGLKREAPADTLAEQMRLLAGRLEAAGAVAEVDAIQGDFDDLVLSIMREYGLRGLAEEGAPDPSPWIATFAGLIGRRRALLGDLEAASGGTPQTTVRVAGALRQPA